ncbi:hypothetical protein K0M31_000711, partial [Melipona bicolor]
AKGGPIAADGLYGQWQSPFPTLPGCQISLAFPLPTLPHRRAAATANTITLSESKRNNPFDDVAYLSKIELPATEPRLLSFDKARPDPISSPPRSFARFISKQFPRGDKLLEESRTRKFQRLSLDLYS